MTRVCSKVNTLSERWAVFCRLPMKITFHLALVGAQILMCAGLRQLATGQTSNTPAIEPRAALSAEQVVLTRSIEMRYARQNHELAVPVGRRATPADLARRFHQAHRRAFGYASPEEPTELVTFRVTATLPVARPAIAGAFESGEPCRGARPVYFESTKGFVETPVLESEALNRLAGTRVLLKAECLQHTGSFKIRGALNRLLQLTDAERRGT